MIDCPACNQAVFKISEKLWFGIFDTLNCPSCEATVKVSRLTSVFCALTILFTFGIPFVLELFFEMNVGFRLMLRITMALVCLSLYLVYHIKYVPLVVVKQ